MNVNMQTTMFSHCKCANCNHLGVIESFELIKKKLSESNEGETTATMFQYIYKCPICTSEHTEALFPNEVN